MNNRWTQFSLKSLLVLALITSAYLAGRVPQIDRVRRAEAQSADAVERSLECREVADFWERLVMDARPDLANSVVSAQSMWNSRKGIGGTYKTVFLEDVRIRPRFLRWRFKFANKEADYASQLNALGIRLVAVWDNPPSILVVSNLGQDVAPSISRQIPVDNLLFKGDELDYRLVERSGIRAEPKLVLKSIPSTLEDHLAWSEALYAKERALNREHIHCTEFELQTDKDEVSVVVVKQEANTRQQ